MVLMSINTDPAAAPSITPSGPRITSSTSGESVSMVMVTSLAAAASAAEPARFAPAATSSSIRDAVRFHTVTSYPAFSRFLLMGLPMMPSPTNPILSVMFSPLKKA